MCGPHAGIFSSTPLSSTSITDDVFNETQGRNEEGKESTRYGLCPAYKTVGLNI